MRRFAKVVFDALRQMDAEASARRNGEPTGLLWYGGHYRPDLTKPQTEPCWTKRLAELLPTLGYPASAEVAYPTAPRSRCDLNATLPGGEKVWLEIKGAWKQYWIENKRPWIYRSYLLHPLAPHLDPKTHTVPLDLQKLALLRRQDGDVAACLLVGFDANSAPMLHDVDELKRLSGLNRSYWEESSTVWADPYRPDGQISCWLWWRGMA